ncbi:hypothetical protein KIL84_006787 [Mauremys mutica]|uniref:Uncharacterized protein n=1 Tax=Mauremys mutica TaxID=74926 RepID=A0A9D3WZV2_9SAUR|nr:hypothetical protein KIL84_006787 [Mauremys mutica]
MRLRSRGLQTPVLEERRGDLRTRGSALNTAGNSTAPEGGGLGILIDIGIGTGIGIAGVIVKLYCSRIHHHPSLKKAAKQEKQIDSPLCNMVHESVKFLHCGVSLTELRTLLEAQKLYLEIPKLKRDLQKYNE